MTRKTVREAKEREKKKEKEKENHFNYSKSGSGAEYSTVKSAKVSSTRPFTSVRSFSARAFDCSDGNVTVSVSDSPWRATETSNGRGRGLSRLQKERRLGWGGLSQNSWHCVSNDSAVKAPGGLIPEILMVRDACENMLAPRREGLESRQFSGGDVELKRLGGCGCRHTTEPWPGFPPPAQFGWACAWQRMYMRGRANGAAIGTAFLGNDSLAMRGAYMGRRSACIKLEKFVQWGDCVGGIGFSCTQQNPSHPQRPARLVSSWHPSR